MNLNVLFTILSVVVVIAATMLVLVVRGFTGIRIGRGTQVVPEQTEIRHLRTGLTVLLLALIIIIPFIILFSALGRSPGIENLKEMGKASGQSGSFYDTFLGGEPARTESGSGPMYWLVAEIGLVIAAIFWFFFILRDGIRDSFRKAVESWQQRPVKFGPLYAPPKEKKADSVPSATDGSTASSGPHAKSGGYLERLGKRFENFFPIELAAELTGEFLENVFSRTFLKGRS